MEIMKIVIAGGSGHLGRLLSQHLTGLGHEIIVLSRNPNQAKPWREETWDGQTLGPWVKLLEGADGLINLAGRSVDCRYNAMNRKEIMDSRILSTRVLGQALEQLQAKPGFWLQMSTATIYAHRSKGFPHDETSQDIGDQKGWDFSIQVAKAWEAEALRWQSERTRLVIMRTAMVMSTEPGGAFEKLVKLTKLGLGGRAGTGKQQMSWIHEEDFVKAVEHLCSDRSEGVVNIAAPKPITQAAFAWHLREALGIPIGIPSPKCLIEFGSFFLRTESELILKSRSVISKRLPASGFQFIYPDWPTAVGDLCRQVR
jgi:uncharacterized protein (TIGR01777 family)